MKYNAPVGAADPNDPYIDGNPGAGVEGSPVPAAAIEHPMREIVSAIVAAGLTPDPDDLTQLSQAIALLTTTYAPGDVFGPSFRTSKTGFLLLAPNATIGKAGSGATYADDGYQTLYTTLWDNITNTYAAVSGGRGANAAADFAAGKTLTLPAVAGRSFIGKGQGAGLTTNWALGQTGGEEKHTQTVPEIPNHDHDLYTINGGQGGSGYSEVMPSTYPGSSITRNTGYRGGSTPFNVIHPVVAANFFIKY